MYLDLFCIRRIQTSIYSQNRRRTSSFLNQPSRAFSSKLISATKFQFWLVLTLFTASAKWKYKGCEESRKRENLLWKYNEEGISCFSLPFSWFSFGCVPSHGSKLLDWSRLDSPPLFGIGARHCMETPCWCPSERHQRSRAAVSK